MRSMSSIRETLLRQAVFELEILLEASPDGAANRVAKSSRRESTT